MDFEIYKQVHEQVTGGQLDTVRDDLASRLSQTGDNPFAAAAGTSFTNTPQEVNAWLANAAVKLAEKIQLKFIYVEMNGFSINYDRWICGPFGYTRALDLTDLDDLSDFDAELHYSEALTLTGMEAMQDAFRQWNDKANFQATEKASTLADLLVQCRYLTLIRDGASAGSLPAPVVGGYSRLRHRAELQPIAQPVVPLNSYTQRNSAG